MTHSWPRTVYNHENLAKGNYAACFGGGTYGASADGNSPLAGVFGVTRFTKNAQSDINVTIRPGTGTKLQAIPDGSSNTVMLAELIPVQSTRDGRGTWLWAGAGGSSFLTHTTPNSTTPDQVQACSASTNPRAPCTELLHPRSTAGLEPQWGELWAAARSYHSGGVNAAMADGSVRFVRDGIDPAAWRAAGTKSGGEALGLD